MFVEFTQPGDDNFVSKANYVEIRISNNIIQNDTDWDNAKTVGVVFDTDFGSAGSYFSKEFDLSQVPELVANNLTSGDLYFAARAGDEANNEGLLSNPGNTGDDTDYIKSKAEFFVDAYLPTGRMYLDYDEFQSMIQGDSANGIPSRALDIGTILATVATPPYNTPAAMEAYLKKMTDTVYDSAGNNYEVCSEAVGGLVQSALIWENINNPKSLSLNARAPPTECSPGVIDIYSPLTDQQMTELRNIFSEHLKLFVDVNHAKYCNLSVPCPAGERWSINH